MGGGEGVVSSQGVVTALGGRSVINISKVLALRELLRFFSWRGNPKSQTMDCGTVSDSQTCVLRLNLHSVGRHNLEQLDVCWSLCLSVCLFVACLLACVVT